MERSAEEIPIVITPALSCEWRWLNTSALACQLGEKQAMQPATRYRMTVSPGIKTEDGVTLTEDVVHTFITQRPKLNLTGFYTWHSPGWPVLRLSFNLPAEKFSMEQNASLVTDG
jgi:alpha-2-macroglobulin